MSTDANPAPVVRNPLMEALRSGRLGLQMFVRQVASVDIAVAAHSCGFDALTIDLEHGLVSESAAAQICVTALGVGITPLVRVPNLDAHYANRLLDAGALGIVAPHVENADQARAVVDACRFMPQGRRSVGYGWPHLGFRAYAPEVERRAIDAATTVVVMLETPQAIERADEIAAVPGVDIVHVGSVDLCEAMGMPGRFTDPALLGCYARLTRACQRHGKFAGAGGLSGNPDVLRQVLQMGVRYVSAGNEWDFMLAAARQRCGQLRALQEGNNL